MSFPNDFHKIDFAQQSFVVHCHDCIIFCHDEFLAIIKGEELVYSQIYRSHPYARADAERAALKLHVEEKSMTEVRRNLEAAEDRGKVTGDFDIEDVFE